MHGQNHIKKAHIKIKEFVKECLNDVNEIFIILSIRCERTEEFSSI